MSAVVTLVWSALAIAPPKSPPLLSVNDDVVTVMAVAPCVESPLSMAPPLPVVEALPENVEPEIVTCDVPLSPASRAPPQL